MTTKAHSTLTGSDLHEPKGVTTATAGQVYISDGAGSGAWTDTGATIGSSAFTTGDLKPTFKTTADSGWVMADDGTIGDLSSGASNLASATTQDLYYLLWNNVSNTYAAVSSGRGASAAADFAAHKTIAIPKMLGRSLSISGVGSGLTARTLGQNFGSESVVLTQGNLPNVTLTATVAAGQGSHAHPIAAVSSNGGANVGGGSNFGFVTTTDTATLPAMTGTVPLGGSATAFGITNPVAYVNIMVKL